MHKTILITGSTDGIGLETAKAMASQGHQVLLHGRNPEKLEDAENMISKLTGESVESYLADLSHLPDVETLAASVFERHEEIDALINNAGIFKTPDPITSDGLDVRFVVNTIAPYLLTVKLLPLLGSSGRAVNLSSAAQSPVNLKALSGQIKISDDLEAYAQSKLAITAWSYSMALSLKDEEPAIIAVNPGSLLATKMVKEGFGMAGNDIHIGADILIRAALSDEFVTASGQYYDNDSRRFTSPHRDAVNPQKTEEIVRAIEAVLADLTNA